jgi:hypothetical protein
MTDARTSDREAVMGKAFDLAAAAKAYRGEMQRFFLDMSQWRKFKSRYRLRWQKVPFAQASKALIPNMRGIYIFTLQLEPSRLPAHGYILYAGQTGAANSSATLRSRFAQYWRNYTTGRGRAKVVFMVQNWKTDLQFNFAPIADTGVNLVKLEKKLLNAVQPPINSKDFDAEITAIRSAGLA